MLLSDEYDRVDELVDELEGSCPDVPDPARVWLFLALAWLREQRDQYRDPFTVIEMLFADFGYPAEIENLVRFMPAPTGAVGQGYLERQWDEYLTSAEVEYRNRD